MKAAWVHVVAAIERLGQIVLEGGGFVVMLIGVLSSAQ
jgi:hypothetical protein